MKCEKIVNKFLALDNGEPTPLSVRFHVFWCSKCRNEIFDLRRNFQSVRGGAAFKAPSDLCDLVMSRIELLEIEYEQNVSNVKWFGAGVVIFASIFSISFSSWADWMISRTGSDFEPFLYGIMGLCLTIYSVSYIATHLLSLRRLFTRVDEGIRIRLNRA